MRVGTRAVPLREWFPVWDHPHACGDKRPPTDCFGCFVGSSPCVWGQDTDMAVNFNSLGIIPMRVGTRCKASQNSLLMRDHPHACGDKCGNSGGTAEKPGSSPCVWGQADFNASYSLEVRIIPMRVGTRFVVYVLDKLFEDHPHACGDKSTYYSSSDYSIGSSPCVWGQASFAVC